MFNTADIRDMVMTNTNKLASLVDAPGIRLEVPQELKPTFCLLSGQTKGTSWQGPQMACKVW